MVYEDICNFGMDQLVITQYKKILKRLLFIKSVANKEKIEIGTKLENEKIFLGYIINYDDRDKDHNDFITGIIAIFHNTKYRFLIDYSKIQRKSIFKISKSCIA